MSNPNSKNSKLGSGPKQKSAPTDATPTARLNEAQTRITGIPKRLAIGGLVALGIGGAYVCGKTDHPDTTVAEDPGMPTVDLSKLSAPMPTFEMTADPYEPTQFSVTLEKEKKAEISKKLAVFTTNYFLQITAPQLKTAGEDLARVTKISQDFIGKCLNFLAAQDPRIASALMAYDKKMHEIGAQSMMIFMNNFLFSENPTRRGLSSFGS